jgi:hypothetical protein
LAAWYSEWYNGLVKSYRARISTIKDDEHQVIVYCKANPGVTIIKAIDTVFKANRKQINKVRSAILASCGDISSQGREHHKLNAPGSGD